MHCPALPLREFVSRERAASVPTAPRRLSRTRNPKTHSSTRKIRRAGQIFIPSVADAVRARHTADEQSLQHPTRTLKVTGPNGDSDSLSGVGRSSRSRHSTECQGERCGRTVLGCQRSTQSKLGHHFGYLDASPASSG
ncbi:hypothetical protein RB4094 [Rhodopirellula baltica SH 1]|uniref:Uncharacterized protein n=1 Tax=Rhodopirellula baltica (strain DSM 10527 / NCIMB 13988 / SH1) TaxID=243090 RepID=Q7UT58_RHOBA|nr:hypothetical protein RB4094 [Rhodopirellula baltica SH 1]